jgi:nucleotide-binding universal stress UspA family protein
MATMPVVVGVDGSRESLRAAEWAAREAERHEAPLRILSVPALPPRLRSYDSVSATVAAALRDQAACALGEAVTRAGEVTSRLLIEARLTPGPPARALTDSGADALMLVVGARGAGEFAAVLLGSVSRYAAMHAVCPVVVVREETSAVHREVVVGIGDPHDATEALAFAFEEAALRGALLVAVHACWSPSSLGEHRAGAAAGQPARPPQAVADGGQALAATLGAWHEKYPAVAVRQDVLRGSPARVLAGYSARADLLVIGRHSADASPAIGAVQHAVLSHARGPVAVVPHPA